MQRKVVRGIALLVVLVAVLGSASPVSAAEFTYQLRKNTCEAHGGTYGYGHLYIKIKHAEEGDTGANKLTIDSKVVHRAVHGTRWSTEMRWERQIYTFPSNATSHWQVGWRTYDPADYAWHRFVITIAAWHNGTRLAHKTIYGAMC